MWVCVQAQLSASVLSGIVLSLTYSWAACSTVNQQKDLFVSIFSDSNAFTSWFLLINGFFQYKSLTRIHYARSDICQVSCHEENWVCASQCGCQRFLTSTFSNLETCMKVCLVCHNCPFSNDCCPLQVYPPLPLFLSSRIITADNNNMTSCLWRSFLCSSLYLSLLPRWSDKLVSDRWCYWWFCFYSSSQKTMRLCLSCSYCEGQSLCVVVVIMIIILLIIIAE